MKSLFCTFVLAFFVVGCSTTNSFIRLTPDYTDLPAAELSGLAGEIEAYVSKGDVESPFSTGSGISVDTPELMHAIRTRAIRNPLISALLDTGFAEELDNGLIEIKRSSAYKKATTSRQRDREAMIVLGENQNRWAIYEGLVKANSWKSGVLSAVQETFFKARVPLMKAGQVHDPVE